MAIDRGNARVYSIWLHLQACQLHGKAQISVRTIPLSLSLSLNLSLPRVDFAAHTHACVLCVFVYIYIPSCVRVFMVMDELTHTHTQCRGRTVCVRVCFVFLLFVESLKQVETCQVEDGKVPPFFVGYINI